MVTFFLHIFDFLHKRRRLCLAILTAIIVLLLVMISSLKYNEDIYDFIPMSENQQKAVTLYQDMTGGKRVVAMIKMADNKADNPDRLMEAVDTFVSKLTANNGARHLKDVTSQFDFEKMAGIADFVYHNLPVMLTDSDYVHMEEILSCPDKIKDQLEQDVQSVMMPATGYFATNIGYDPLSLFAPVLTRLQKKQSSLPFEMDNGYIFTADKRYAIVMMTSAYGSMESANNTLLVNYVDSISTETMKSMPDVSIGITGSPVIAVDNANQIKADSRIAISIALVLILVLLILAFRNGKNLLLIGFSILFGWLFAMAFIAVFRSNVSLIVLGIGSIIIGIAVNYPLHFVAHMAHGGSTREVLKEMVSPLLIGNITTVGAFASLIPLDAPALRDLGLFAAFMLVGTILFVLIFLPHLVTQKQQHGEERLLFGRLSSFTLRIKGWMFWLIVVLTGIFGYFSLDTSFDSNMHHINYLTPTQKRLLGDLHVSAGVQDTSKIYLVSEGATWDEALSRRSRYTPLLDSLKTAKDLEDYSSVTQFVCSEAEQSRRIKRWNDFWEKHLDHALSSLRAYAPIYGFNEDAFSGFAEIINKSYEPHPLKYYEPLVSTLFEHSFSNSTGRCSVVDVIETGSGNIAQVEATINGFEQDNGYSFDFVGMNSAVANALSSDFNYIGFACGIIVFAFLWISFGRIELSILAFLPMAIGWLWILGIMNLLDMQFNIVNIILATFIFGQGDDYTIFMTDGLINEYAYKKKLLPSYKNSIVISALIMFIGMGSLIVAKHPALHSLAEVTIVGMLTVVMMAWIIPPMIFNWLTKSGKQVRRAPVTFEQIVRSTYCSAVYLFELFYGCILGFLIKLMPWRKKKNEDFMHRVIYRTMKTNLWGISGVKINIHNDNSEDFSRGSILICNHQSILDPILLLALSPRILLLVSEKVWRNPIVRPLFKLAGFICIDQHIDILKKKIATAIDKGYNVVIFPEGKRNEDQITRFHQGAFYLSREIGADILSVYIHGAGHVMPKGNAFAARGQIDIEIGQRIPATQLSRYGENDMLVARHFYHEYIEHYEKMKRQIRTPHYFHHHIVYQYTYKGVDIERETRHLLRQNNDYSEPIDSHAVRTDCSVSISDGGHGQYPMLLALVHPELEVHSYVNNPDDVSLALACSDVPKNLHVHLSAEPTEK